MKTRILSALLLVLAGQSVLAVEEAPSALQEITAHTSNGAAHDALSKQTSAK